MKRWLIRDSCGEIAAGILTILHQLTDDGLDHLDHLAERLVARHRSSGQRQNRHSGNKDIIAGSLGRRMVAVLGGLMVLHQHRRQGRDVQVLMHLIEVALVEHRRGQQFVQRNDLLREALGYKQLGLLDQRVLVLLDLHHRVVRHLDVFFYPGHGHVQSIFRRRRRLLSISAEDSLWFVSIPVPGLCACLSPCSFLTLPRATTALCNGMAAKWRRWRQIAKLKPTKYTTHRQFCTDADIMRQRGRKCGRRAFSGNVLKNVILLVYTKNYRI